MSRPGTLLRRGDAWMALGFEFERRDDRNTVGHDNLETITVGPCPIHTYSLAGKRVGDVKRVKIDLARK